jgi:hypothetical protein
VSSITGPQVRAFLTEGRRTGKLSFLSSVASWWRVQPTKVLAVFDMTG